MTYYSVLAVTPTTEEWIPDYGRSADSLIAKHGGKFLTRTSGHERLEGEGESAAVRVIIEWPSKEAAEAFYDDPEYRPYRDARQNGSDSELYLVAGEDIAAG